MEEAISRTKEFVANQMSGFDSSHDFSHVLRVLSTALHIAKEEESRMIKSKDRENATPIKYDKDLIMLAALLHDVWDRKYVPAGLSIQDDVIKTLSQVLSLPMDMVSRVDDIISHVSYTTEAKDPLAVQDAIKRNPELACVQDADRLDALGAIGVGRAFVYNAVRVERVKAGATNLGTIEDGYNSMVGAITHYEEKLLKLESMMKTQTGKEMARVKTERLWIFQQWWNEEWDSTEDTRSKESLIE